MKCKYGIIDKEKEQLFEKLLPDYYMKEDRHADTVAIGALNKGRSCAVIILRKKSENDIMKIEYLAVAEPYRRMNIGSVLLQYAQKAAKAHGFQTLEIAYPYEMAGDLSGFLNKNGFNEAEILGITYELSKDMLGDFLKNDYDARDMEQRYIEKEKKSDIVSLADLPEDARDAFEELYPVPELSSVIIRGRQTVAYSIVSRYENSFFVSSIYTKAGEIELIAALVYRSMGIVYMNMEDDETMVFTGYKKQNMELLSFLFDPVLDYGIKRRIMMRSMISLYKERKKLWKRWKKN